MNKSGLGIFRAYLLCAVFCLCATALACGAVVADGETRSVSSGYSPAIVAAAISDDKLDIYADEKNIVLELPDSVSGYACALPFPAGCIAAVCKKAYSVLEYYFPELVIVHK